MIRERLDDLAAPHGLICRGAAPEAEHWVYLLGPKLPDFWEVFAASAEYADGQDHSLDRWSRRVITAIATEVGGSPLFPFGGPPYQPFLRWAAESGEAWSSPVGPLVHHDAGLFISFRGAIALDQGSVSQPKAAPCAPCAQPCKTACPIGALSDKGYDVAACRDFVASDAGSLCRSAGCRVRHACPVGAKPDPAQAAFHMEAFVHP